MTKPELDGKGDGEPTVFGKVEFDEAGNPTVSLAEGAARGASDNGAREFVFDGGPAERVLEIIDSPPRTGPIATAADQTGIIRSVIGATNTASELKDAVGAQAQHTPRGLDALKGALEQKQTATKAKQLELVSKENRLLGSIAPHREALIKQRDKLISAILAQEDLIQILLQEYSLRHPGNRLEAFVAKWRRQGKRYYRKKLEDGAYKTAEEKRLKAEREKLLEPLAQSHRLAATPSLSIVGQVDKEPSPENIFLPRTCEEVNLPSKSTEYLDWKPTSKAALILQQLRPLLVQYRSNADDLETVSDLLTAIGTCIKAAEAEKKRLADESMTSAVKKPKS
ncbi:MAG: hypothetical protein AAB588_05330 [Patescibacteria group bacterium]